MPNRLGGRKNQESIYSSTMGYGVGEGNINTNVIPLVCNKAVWLAASSGVFGFSVKNCTA